MLAGYGQAWGIPQVTRILHGRGAVADRRSQHPPRLWRVNSKGLFLLPALATFPGKTREKTHLLLLVLRQKWMLL